MAASQYVQKVLGLEPDLSIIFVATKCDLAELNHKIAVTHEEAGRSLRSMTLRYSSFVASLELAPIK